MTTRAVLATLVAVLCASGVTLARRLHYPTAHVPRTANGR